MKHINLTAVLVAVILSMPAKLALAVDTTDYSGKYVVEQPKKGQNGIR